MAIQGARAYEPIDDNPDSGGGPIRRSPLDVVRIDAGNFVQRSPHPMIPDPGRQDEPQLLTQKFLPDGRLVPDRALGAALPYRARVALYGGLFALAGAAAGAWVGGPGGRGKGAVTGGLVGLGASVLGALGGE